MSQRHFRTRAIHDCRADLCGPGRPIVTPIYQVSSFAFRSAEDYADVIQEKREGFVYTRLGNPTFAALHAVMASLESGEAATSFGSGMAAVHSSLMALLESGQHIVAHRSLYGGSFTALTKVLPRAGIETSFVDATQPERVAEAIRPTTRAIYIETIGNPTLDVVDIAAVAEVARAHGVPLLVDNTFATPYLCRPLELGATLSIHSATKYIGGHADLVGGIAVGPADLIYQIDHYTQSTGAINSPLHAWLMIRGLKTLALRMDRHCENALQVARFLEAQPAVERVHYPGLPSHPHHDVAKRQLDAFGGMVAAEVRGGREGGMRFMDRLKLCLIAPSLGDVATLATHPASTTHRNLSKEELAQAGIAEGLVRISVGIEHIDDILADLAQALVD